MMKHLLVLAVTLVSFSVSTPRAIGGCRYDSQCKGDQICKKGVCVSPASKEAPAATLAPDDKHWITDQRTKCRVWNQHPQPNELILWFGVCKNGLAEGYGAVEWFVDGKSYEVDQGDWHDGKMHGPGVMTFANGNRYEGDFREGKENGHGVLTKADGDRYEGDFREGKATGHGVMTFADGDQYDGDFRDNKRTGHGVLTKADGDRFEGDFRDDKPTGHGVLTRADGDRFDGEWDEGCFRDGNGIAAIGRKASSCP